MAEDSQQDVSVPAEESVQTDTAVEQTTEVESSPTEQTNEQVSEEVATSEDTEQVEEQTEQGEEEAEANEPGEELAPKSQNRFQKLANENKGLRYENQELKQKLAQLEDFQVPTEQDYLDGGYDPIEAKVNALEARQAQRESIDNVASLNVAVDSDMSRIIHEYPELDPGSKDFNKDLAIRLFEQYDQDAQTRYADDGIVLETKQLPYQYIKSKMDLINIASSQKKVQAQKDVEKMVSQAETPTSQAPPVSKDDSLESMRERLSNVKF
jgi:hypothetical protein